MMKLTMATVLATATVIGSLVEVATANTFLGATPFLGQGRKYSDPSNQPDFQFSLFNKTSGGNIISDANASDNFGFFKGAIKNVRYSDDCDFNAANCQQTVDGMPIEKNGEIVFAFSTGNLLTMLDGNVVKYTIYSEEPFDLLQIPLSQPQKILKQDLLGAVYTFEVDVSMLSEEEKNKSVNSLQFIIENNLPAFGEKASFVESTFGFKVSLPGGVTNKEVCGDGSLVSGVCVTEIPDTTVPEPSTSVGLLALGVLGARLLRKRKMA